MRPDRITLGLVNETESEVIQIKTKIGKYKYVSQISNQSTSNDEFVTSVNFYKDSSGNLMNKTCFLKIKFLDGETTKTELNLSQFGQILQ